MIKIIEGTYGYWNGQRVEPKTKKSEPFRLEPEKEQRLVNRGIAEFIEVKQEEPVAKQVTSELEEKPKYSERMKLDELKEVAKYYGVDASEMKVKTEIVRAIKATEEATEDEAPSLGAVDPV